MADFNFTSIAIIHSCYKEKFGIPRQPGLVSSPATIEMHLEYSQDEAFRELDTFSHIWVSFIFHAIDSGKWKPTVRPPRLGGNRRVGVFATRSMFRPNPVGLSVVELKSIERKDGKIILNVIGGDFLDGTPVIDIKPYIAYADSISSASSGYVTEKPEAKFAVIFAAEVIEELLKAEKSHPNIKNIITQILQLDPRPAYKNKNKPFAIKLYEFDLKWHIEEKTIVVTELDYQME